MDQIYKCPNFNCGFEARVIAPSRDRAAAQKSPICACGTPLKRWPETALKTDQFEDV